MAEQKVQKGDSYSVYVHIFPNGKRYFGITKSKPKYRWSGEHKAYKGCPKMYNAIMKHGWDNILHEVLFANLSKKDAETKEAELIAKYKTTETKYGYNMAAGGKAPYGVKRSAETRQKMSAAKCKMWADKEWREKKDARKNNWDMFEVARYNDAGLIEIYGCITEAEQLTGISSECIIDSIYSNDGKWLFKYTVISKAMYQFMKNWSGEDNSIFKWISQYYEEAVSLGLINDNNAERTKAYLQYKIDNPPDVSYRNRGNFWNMDGVLYGG